MSSIRDGIQKFLQARIAESPYLIPKWDKDMESQYLVHQGSVEVEGNEGVWTDGQETWCNHRWPHKAGTDPNYADRKLTFSPGAHLKRFGSTWWNFKKKRSIAVALDIDLEGDHAESTTTVTTAKLADLEKRLKTLPYITLVRSSGGQGIHIYTFFDEKDLPVAVNHNEHTQVAKSLVSKISDDLTYNLKQHMDAIGVIFWLWSCDSPEGHEGYKLIQEQTVRLGAKDLIPYRDANLAGPNANIKVKGYEDDGTQVINEEQGGGYKVHDLEPEHSEFLKELEDMGFSFIWQPSHNMAHTHTVAIQRLYEKRANEGRPLRGIFTTVSAGSDKSKPNCYITPRPDGVFQCKRFGTGTAETLLWQTKDGDTWCYLNQEAPVLQVMRKCAKTYSFMTGCSYKMVFDSEGLEQAMKAFGHTLGESINSINVPINVSVGDDGIMTASFDGEGNYEGWEKTKKGFSRQLPVIHKKVAFKKSVLDEADKFVRHVVTPDYEPYGWALKCGEHWIMYPGFDPVSCVVSHVFGSDAKLARSEMTQNPWILHHLPFGKEYPGGRLWNRQSPQLAIPPASEPGPHPHWDMIMDHLGKSLDTTIEQSYWCQEWGIHSGADYLRYWISALIQDPMEQLPYLFFYGPQNSGKSIFHESLSTLFTCGVTNIGTALCSGPGYNAEIANAVIGFVEEKDLSGEGNAAYAKIKEWVMAKTIAIHKKGHTPYDQPNTLHMVQMANHPKSISMEDGDTRITAILVNMLKKEVPKKVMFEALEKEAAYFLRTILTINIPQSHTRLRLPMIATQHKRDLESMSQTPFEVFCEENLYPCEGHTVKITDFYAKYRTYCTEKNTEPERRTHVIQMLRNRTDKYLIGVGNGKQTYIANVSMESNLKPKRPYKLNDKGRLARV